MDIRTELTSELKKYLMGPYTDDEVLHDWPEELYISGLLFPKDVGLEAEDLETLDAGSPSEDEPSEENSRTEGLMLQNSIGIRCNLHPEIREVSVDISYARYNYESFGWNRLQISKKFTINLDDTILKKEIADKNGEFESEVSWKIDTDKNAPPRYRVLSVFLSNEMILPEEKENDEKLSFKQKKILKNGRIIFQPSIRIEGMIDSVTFLGTNVHVKYPAITEEEQMLDLLFREKIVYAQGYSCAADWDKAHSTPRFVRTEILPEYESKNILVSSKDDGGKPEEVEMRKIAFAKNSEEIEKIVLPIIEKYSKWIENLDSKIVELSKNPDYSELSGIAKENKKKCSEALGRIKDGFSMLKDNSKPEILEAFILANRAMLYQRVHYDFAIKRSKGRKDLPRRPDVTEENKNFWRPFQIAFLLMNLRGIADKQSDDREIVELLWFPTGGGKTEAYLALSAFAIVLRRLRGSEENDGLGVSVMMRYTLRLLTLQQFERASTLICALEVFRRKDPGKLGREPFLIGLWVGWTLTPNTSTSSKESLDRLAGGGTPDTGSPIQMNFCPWCGKDMSYRNYFVDEKRTEWTIVHCDDPACDFYHREKNDTTRALPILTVDFDIYRRCPSMLVSTVDKFARLPWRPEISSIFGRVERKCPRCGFLSMSSKHPSSYHNEKGKKIIVQPCDTLDGPDLIIQDELHLITGPIGTMVGLYETAVEFLSSRTSEGKIVKPKIVVSTATINGVERQIRKLFNRKNLRTFPPPGTEYGDAFFWWEEKKGGRKFLAVSYSHRSMKFALAKVYASLLQRVHEIISTIPDKNDIDPYWTLVGYFNSTRELGGAIRLVQDDVKSNIAKIIGSIPSHNGMTERDLEFPEELSGRIKGEDIRKIRKNLEMSFTALDSIDVLLATNMISVGIDVERLGLMVVNGQTKNSSEYIQATGRIGRRESIQGMIFVVYNPYKPRDLSHYEDFVGHHMVLQKSVEPVGLTPFSDRAMERALHAVFIGIIRLTINHLSANADANNFTLDNHEVVGIQNAILERYLSVQDVDESDKDFLATKKMLQQFQDNWYQFIQECSRQRQDVYYLDDSEYDQFGTVAKKQRVLMADFASYTTDSFNKFPKSVPGSLRDVETEANMFYV